MLKTEKINNTKILLNQYKKYKEKIESLDNNKIIPNMEFNNANIKNQIFQSDEFNALEKNEFLSKFKKDKNLYDLFKCLKEIQEDLIMGPAKLSINMLDPRGNKFEGWSEGEKRGGLCYDPQLRWIGFGLKVRGKYDDGNDNWIGKNNISSWCVAYHGVGRGQSSKKVKEIIGLICKNRFKPGCGQTHKNCSDINHPGKKVGDGVYFCQEIKKAEEYAGIININGLNYKVVLMTRIKPSSLRRCNDGPYYLVTSELTMIQDLIEYYSKK